MEELFDKELQGLVKFTDATKQQKSEKKQPAPTAAPEKKNAPQQKKPAQRNEATDESWYPAKGNPTFFDCLKACTKWVALFGGLIVLLFYWQQTGQMQSSAAVPSMLVCALMAGVGVGINWKWN